MWSAKSRLWETTTNMVKKEKKNKGQLKKKKNPSLEKKKTNLV